MTLKILTRAEDIPDGFFSISAIPYKAKEKKLQKKGRRSSLPFSAALFSGYFFRM